MELDLTEIADAHEAPSIAGLSCRSASDGALWILTGGRSSSGLLEGHRVLSQPELCDKFPDFGWSETDPLQHFVNAVPEMVRMAAVTPTVICTREVAAAFQVDAALKFFSSYRQVRRKLEIVKIEFFFNDSESPCVFVPRQLRTSCEGQWAQVMANFVQRVARKNGKVRKRGAVTKHISNYNPFAEALLFQSIDAGQLHIDSVNARTGTLKIQNSWESITGDDRIAKSHYIPGGTKFTLGDRREIRFEPKRQRLSLECTREKAARNLLTQKNHVPVPRANRPTRTPLNQVPN
jgi:hypothetical protein